MEEGNKGGGWEWRMGCQMGVINKERDGGGKRRKETGKEALLHLNVSWWEGGHERTVQGEVRGKVKVKQRLEER